MEIALVAAVSENNAIGAKGGLPWKIASDMKLFKNLTLHHVVLMGRQTFESIGKALPNRENIVISRSWQGTEAENIRVFSSIDEALAQLKLENKTKVLVIGGGTIYEQTMPLANKLYITRVKTTVPDADTWFPPINLIQWKLCLKNSLEQGPKDEYPIEFQAFNRILA